MRANPFSLHVVLSAYLVVPLLFFYVPNAIALTGLGGGGDRDRCSTVPVCDGPTARKDERWPLVSSEFGEISAVKINDGRDGIYHLHFITMEPRSLFLPVQLYTEMVFYVNSGNGSLCWINAGHGNYELKQIKLRTGDIFRLQPQTVFYLQNNLDSEDPQKLQIYAIFSDSENELQNKQFAQVYAAFHNLVLGFDNKVLQATLTVKEEAIKELRGGERQPLIVQGELEANTSMAEADSLLIRAFLGIKNNDIFSIINKKKKDKDKKDKKKKEKDKKKKDKKEKDKKGKDEKKEDETKACNIFEADHDVESNYGWSATVSSEQSDVFQESDFGVFMVNLTKGSMMGPHWNPTSAEVAIVLHGQGIVQVVCPMIPNSIIPNETVCKNLKFKVEEGDVFVVPRNHPMAQISFDNESLIFMGFRMTSANDPPQYLGGGTSVLQTLDKSVVAKSFGVSNTTLMDEVLSAKNESIIIECASCAEDNEKLNEEKSDDEIEGGEGRQEVEETEGEIASRQEEEMIRRQIEAEEATARLRRVTVKSGGRQESKMYLHLLGAF